MTTLDDLDRLVGWMQSAGVETVSVAGANLRLVLRMTRDRDAAAAVQTRSFDVTTTGMGEFLPAHPRRPNDSLELGEAVDAGAIIGFLKSGLTLSPIVAEEGGRVAEIHAQPGALLGYGAAVFTLAQEK